MSALLGAYNYGTNVTLYRFYYQRKTMAVL